MKSFRLLVLAAALVLSYAVAAAAAPACTKKIDSFDFVVDYSGSMMMKNAQLKQDKIIVAKSVLQRINAAIPALNYNGGLHTISPNGVIVAQGPWDRATMAAGINKLRSGFDVFGRMTRMGTGLQAYEPFLSSMKRDAAVILVTDGDNNRGADLVEVAECWEVALTQSATPSVMALSRQNLIPARKTHTNQNLSAKGAYVLAEATGKRQVILIATGSEVEIALKAREALEAEGIGTRVVSMPSMELFAAQDEAYRRKIQPPGAVRVAVEAAVQQPWDRWLLGERGTEKKAGFVGMTGFGASAPAERLYQEFGITAEAVAEKVKSLL